MSFSAPRPPAALAPRRPRGSCSYWSSEIAEQWLGTGDNTLHCSSDGAAGSLSVGENQQCGEPPAAAPAAKKRGRKPGSTRGTNGSVVSHVEAGRQRRDKLNCWFCDLRAAVRTVSRMDKASLLADATAYIAQLRGRVEKLEAEARRAAAAPISGPSPPLGLEEKLEVWMIGWDAAALRLTSAARHAPHASRTRSACWSCRRHASVCGAEGVTVLDAVVDVPAGPLRGEAWLRAALLQRLQTGGCRSLFLNN